jgi:hypothetical protein
MAGGMRVPPLFYPACLSMQRRVPISENPHNILTHVLSGAVRMLHFWSAALLMGMGDLHGSSYESVAAILKTAEDSFT